jgi:ribonuclease HI
LNTRIIINTDGASRGNPGPAAIGVTLKNGKEELVAVVSEKIGITTNNQAEYRALIAGLKKALSLGAREVVIRADSELMVRQLSGQYRVKNADLKPLYEEARKLLGGLVSCKVEAIPRERNKEADNLANQALDTPGPS